MIKKKYAVIGNPIKHSKSPEIHQQFAEQVGIDLSYEKLFSDVDKFKETVTEFIKNGGNGMNVTVPFKEQAFELADELDDYAKIAQAVNTLSFKNGKIFGSNTDGVGLVEDLTKRCGIKLKDKRILLIGAGGASRGVLYPLIMHSPKHIHIANRTVSKADELVKFSQPIIKDLISDKLISKVEVTSSALNDDISKNEKIFDIVINASSSSLHGQVPQIPSNGLVDQFTSYDMMYGDTKTSFQIWSESHNARCALDGFGMLVEQAAKSFYIWNDEVPDTDVVMENLLSQ